MSPQSDCTSTFCGTPDGESGQRTPSYHTNTEGSSFNGSNFSLSPKSTQSSHTRFSTRQGSSDNDQEFGSRNSTPTPSPSVSPSKSSLSLRAESRLSTLSTSSKRLTIMPNHPIPLLGPEEPRTSDDGLDQCSQSPPPKVLATHDEGSLHRVDEDSPLPSNSHDTQECKHSKGSSEQRSFPACSNMRVKSDVEEPAVSKGRQVSLEERSSTNS